MGLRAPADAPTRGLVVSVTWFRFGDLMFQCQSTVSDLGFQTVGLVGDEVEARAQSHRHVSGVGSPCSIPRAVLCSTGSAMPSAICLVLCACCWRQHPSPDGLVHGPREPLYHLTVSGP